MALLICGAAQATQVVLFSDGRMMTVQSVERKGEMVLLTLEGGGSIAVPFHRVSNWSELSVVTAPRAGGGAARTTAAWRLRAGPFAEAIGDAAQRHEVDPVLLTAMAEVESSFDARAVSHKGASGLLQLMPETAKRFGVGDVFDATQNANGGARYLRWLLERYEGQTELALAGYNAGEAAVDRYQGIPPFPETRAYVTRVLAGVERLSPAPGGG
jgi:soluble lytic murein transglycosylase-like protein